MLINLWIDLLSSFLHIVISTFCSSIKLIAHHRQPTAPLSERRKHLQYAVIGARRVQRVIHIVRAESVEDLLEPWVLITIGRSTDHQHPDAIAHEPPHSIPRVFRHPKDTQGIVYGCRQVVKRVEQRPVEVEYIGIVLLHLTIVWTIIFCKITTFYPFQQERQKLFPKNLVSLTNNPYLCPQIAIILINEKDNIIFLCYTSMC